MNSFDATAINPVSGTPGVVTFAGVNGTPERAFATDWNNVGPRVGFAYQLSESGRTVMRGGTGIFYGPTVSNTIGDTAALGFSTAASFVVSQATTQSAFLLRDGFPAYSRPALTSGLGAVAVGQKPNTAVSFFDPNQVAPTSYQSNLSLQHELGSGLVVEVGYIGNISHHLTANDFSLNQVPTELMGPGDTQRAASVPAVQQRHADQSVDRQVQLLRRIRARAEAVLGRVLAAGALHAVAVHGRCGIGQRVREAPAATWTPTIAISIGRQAPATFRTTSC